MSSTTMRRLGWFLIPILALLGLLGWIFQPTFQTSNAAPAAETSPIANRAAAEEAAATPTTVEATTVVRRSLPIYSQVTGHLRPWRQVTLSSEIAGRVVWKEVVEGDRVEHGDVLVRLDTRDLRLEHSEAETNLLKARADFAISFVNVTSSGDALASRKTVANPLEEDPRLRLQRQSEESYARTRELFAEGLVSESELERARRRQEAAKMLSGDRREDIQAATSGLTLAELRLEWAKLGLERAHLTAPFSGRVADLDVELGQQLSVGHPCLVILDDSKITVDVDVLESDMIFLRRGTPASVRVPALGDQRFQGLVHTINPRVDAETGTGRVTIQIENPDGALLAGLFAIVDLEIRQLENRLVVPSEALLERQERTVVFRVEQEHALWTYVEPGVQSNGWVEIVEGLEEGQEVATRGHFTLAHQAPVQVTWSSLTDQSPRGGQRPQTSEGSVSREGR